MKKIHILFLSASAAVFFSFMVLHAGENTYAPAVPAQTARALAEKAEWVFDHAQVVSYSHPNNLPEDQVWYQDNVLHAETDCSGFISYLLYDVARRSYEAVEERRHYAFHPNAADFAEFFSELPKDASFAGWKSVPSWRMLCRGDVIAWKKNPKTRSASSVSLGHVAVVLSVGGVEHGQCEGVDITYVSIYVIDSSSVYHFPPETFPPNSGQRYRNGVGKGYIRLIIDEQDRVTGYWEGVYWGEGKRNVRGPSFGAMICFGRLE